MGRDNERFSLDDFEDIEELVEFDELDDVDDTDDLEDIDDIDIIDEDTNSIEKELVINNDSTSSTINKEEHIEEILAKEDKIEDKKEEENDDEDDEDEPGNNKIWIIAAGAIIVIVIVLLLLSSCNKKYTVTFESNGGTSVMEQEIEENGLVVEPDKPLRKGYVFLGWYHGDKKFDFSTGVTSDITLEAKWINGDDAEVRGVTLDQTNVTIKPNDTILLVATVEPEGALEQNVEWASSNEDVAIVDSNGNVTALKEGKTKILVTTVSGGYTAMCTVTVSADTVPVEKITLDKTILNMETKDKVTLTATIEPVDATNKGVIWKSDNENVATVNSLGTVEAVGAGSAIITATTKDGDFSAIVKVNVKNVSVKNIALNVDKLTMEEKEVADLKVIFDPENTTDTSVVWTSSDPKIVRVDTKGKIYALKAGHAIITVSTSDGSKSATCNVTVKGLSGLIIDIINKKDNYYVDDKIELKASPNPSDVPMKKVTWTSSDNNIASVNSDGVVSAKSAGTVVITATNENGITGTLSLTIESKSNVSGIKINESNINIYSGDKLQLTTTLVPSNSPLEELVWTSSNNNIVTVDNGLISAKGNGTATITVALKNKPSIKYSVDVKVTRTEISLTKEDNSILNGSHVLPLNSSIKVKVTSNNKNAKLKYSATNGLNVTGVTNNEISSGDVVTITNTGLTGNGTFGVSYGDTSVHLYFSAQ